MYNLLDGPYSLGSWVRGETVFPKGIRSAGPKIGPDRIPYDTGNISPEFSKTITDTLHVKDINQCIRQLFPPQKMFANSMFILNNRGLDVTTSLHSLLLNQTWEQICHLDLHHLEYNVLMLLNNLFMVTRQHLKYEVIDNLDNILGSFLRVPISSKPIIVPHNRNLYSSTKHKQLEALNDVVIGALLCLNM